MTVKELSGAPLLSPISLPFNPISTLANYSEVHGKLTGTGIAVGFQSKGRDHRQALAIIRMVGTRDPSAYLIRKNPNSVRVAYLYQCAGQYGALMCRSVRGQENFSGIEAQQPMLIFDDESSKQLYYAHLPSAFE